MYITKFFNNISLCGSIFELCEESSMDNSFSFLVGYKGKIDWLTDGPIHNNTLLNDTQSVNSLGKARSSPKCEAKHGGSWRPLEYRTRPPRSVKCAKLSACGNNAFSSPEPSCRNRAKRALGESIFISDLIGWYFEVKLEDARTCWHNKAKFNAFEVSNSAKH